MKLMADDTSRFIRLTAGWQPADCWMGFWIEDYQ